MRDESRGAHYKPDFPERNDEKFLKTTKASYVGGAPKLELEDVDMSQIKPRPRTVRRSEVGSGMRRMGVKIAARGDLPAPEGPSYCALWMITRL